ncbi:MAG TPA: hypothetical protein DEP53_19685 [Bacteroidetes bacterium]|nr:hypothetical protein [Bacteroidota bacterium]
MLRAQCLINDGNRGQFLSLRQFGAIRIFQPYFNGEQSQPLRRANESSFRSMVIRVSSGALNVMTKSEDLDVTLPLSVYGVNADNEADTIVDTSPN